MLAIDDKDLGTPASKSTKLVTLEIDGHVVSVPEGTSVLRAAAIAGVAIPKLCATDSMAAFGSCRLCLIEVEGRNGCPASCTTPVESGIKVRTRGEKLEKLRRGVMELYMSDHPLDASECKADGNCELHRMAREVGLDRVRYNHGARTHLDLPVDDSNPYFSFDPTRCILCSRCVRACDDIQGTFALTIDGRGFNSLMSPGQHQHYVDSECVSCGACVQACPTDALMEKTVLEKGLGDRAVVTTCGYCGVGCSFKAEVRGDEVVRMVPNKDGLPNHGHSCVKGRFAWGYATHPDRVRTPMIRERIQDPWREVSWDEAIAFAARELKRVQAKYGRGSLGGITSSRCTNEEAYLVQKLVRAAFGNNNVDTCARVCHSPTGYGLKTAFGTPAGTNDFDSVLESDVIVVIGANPTEGHPVFCVDSEAAHPRGRAAHRRRSAPDRTRAHAACRGRLLSATDAGHQRRAVQCDVACGRDRGSRERKLRQGAMRPARVSALARFHRRGAQLTRGGREDHRRAARKRFAAPRGSMRRDPTPRFTTASA